MMKHALTAAASITLLGVPVALAQVDKISRVNEYQVDFLDNSAFSDAVFYGNVRSEYEATNAGDRLDGVVFNFGAGSSERQVRSLDPGSLAIENVGVNPNNDTGLIYDLAFSQPGFASTELTWVSNIGSLPLNVSVIDNRWVLDITTGGTDDPGITYDFILTLAGDWSSIGTGTGQAELLGFNPNWTITDFFVFDGTNTVFRAEFDNYQGTDDNPNASVRLYGDVVPAPATLGLVTLAGLATARRRR